MTFNSVTSIQSFKRNVMETYKKATQIVYGLGKAAKQNFTCQKVEFRRLQKISVFEDLTMCHSPLILQFNSISSRTYIYYTSLTNIFPNIPKQDDWKSNDPLWSFSSKIKQVKENIDYYLFKVVSTDHTVGDKARINSL